MWRCVQILVNRAVVEYADPSGVYAVISNALKGRLPLRDLNWKSSSRPLRSIDSLHVNLVPDEQFSARARPATLKSSANVETQEENVGSIPAQGSIPKSEEIRKQRRHQIPGLRQTPYLKIYLLRCDDVETYKSIMRKNLREWVQAHSPPSQSATAINKQENHDAFEWLIVHVSSLNEDSTARAPPPGDNSAERSTERSSSSSRWSSRSSASVLEKVRSDFNRTSKHAVDRVTHIQAPQLGKEGDQQDPKAQAGWDDLIAKFKSLILASFDLRVSQYEEDLREKDAQRNLPGWNFNTFFVLKEGLLRGFESVGLIEDALTGYHELAVSLSAILEDQDSRDQGTGIFRDYTEDLLAAYQSAVEAKSKGSSAIGKQQVKLEGDEIHGNNSASNFGTEVLDTSRKPFRELILANDISAFEFQSYVFARQSSLLLRLANANSANIYPASPLLRGNGSQEGELEPDSKPQATKNQRSSHEDLHILSELSRQAIEFITSAARSIRADLSNGIIHARKEPRSDETSYENVDIYVVENIVNSWVFSACHSVLECTETRSLSEQAKPLLNHLRNFNSSLDQSEDEANRSSNGKESGSFPKRGSSLRTSISSPVHNASFGKMGVYLSMDALKSSVPGSTPNDVQDLAAERAELLSLSRSALSNLGYQHQGWKGTSVELASYAGPVEAEMKEVPLEKGSDPSDDQWLQRYDSKQRPTTHGVLNQVLCRALQSENDFYAKHEVSIMSKAITVT